MVKTDFIKLIAQKTEKTIDETKEFYEAFIEAIQETIPNEKLILAGFGSFELKHKEARKALNPKNGEEIDVAEQDVPAFKFAKGFKDMF